MGLFSFLSKKKELPPLPPIEQLSKSPHDLPKLNPTSHTRTPPIPINHPLPPVPKTPPPISHSPSQSNEIHTHIPKMSPPPMEEPKIMPKPIPTPPRPIIAPPPAVIHHKAAQPHHAPIHHKPIPHPSAPPQIKLPPRPKSPVPEQPPAPKPIVDIPHYVKVDEFQQMLGGIKVIKDDLNACGELAGKLNELKNLEDKEFEKYRAQLEDLQRRLIYVDKVLYEAKGEA
jgi:hypothetical protein|tara:strand:- start:9 stop:692 length:684 start_codon:yes stop_codon:yes gene_type:complete